MFYVCFSSLLLSYLGEFSKLLHLITELQSEMVVSEMVVYIFYYATCMYISVCINCFCCFILFFVCFSSLLLFYGEFSKSRYLHLHTQGQLTEGFEQPLKKMTDHDYAELERFKSELDKSVVG